MFFIKTDTNIQGKSKRQNYFEQDTDNGKQREIYNDRQQMFAPQ